MERHAEVGEDAVDAIDAIIAQEVGEIPEVAVDHRESAVAESAAHGVLVLVEGIEVAVGAETLDNGA